MNRVIRIAAVSVGSDDLAQLRQAVESARGRLPVGVRWVESADADVLLIDVDSIAGHMDWVRARGSGRRIIALSSRPAGQGEAGIQRPITADGVAGALSFWVGESAAEPEPLSAAPAGAAPAPLPIEPAASAAPAPALKASPAPPPAPAPLPEAGVAAAESTAPPAAAVALELSLAEFCTLEALPQAARIVLGDSPSLTIDNEQGVYFGPPGVKALEPYARAAIPRAAWEPVSPAVLAGLRAAGGAQPTTRLVWLTALHAGQGQLLGLDPGVRVRMVRWPQIEREFPRHFRIATVMMKGFATIDEIAAQSGAQPADVADFVNASLAVGHAEVEAAAGAATIPAGDATPAGLLGRLGLRGRKG